jgi:hypothetical protein
VTALNVNTGVATSAVTNDRNIMEAEQRIEHR